MLFAAADKTPGTASLSSSGVEVVGGGCNRPTEDASGHGTLVFGSRCRVVVWLRGEVARDTTESASPPSVVALGNVFPLD